MTTELKRFGEAYATITVAVYEPLIIRWLSRPGIWLIADVMVQRARTTQNQQARRLLLTNHPQTEFKRLPADPVDFFEKRGIHLDRLLPGSQGSINAEILSTINGGEFDRFPDLKITGDDILFSGNMRVKGADGINAVSDNIPGLPVVVSADARVDHYDFDVNKVRGQLINDFLKVFVGAAKQLDKLPASELRKELLDTTAKHLKGIKADIGIDFLPIAGTYFEALSPIGVAHFYRQLYFYLYEGVGPIEQAFTIAPQETLEVVYETIRRQIHEEVTELGSEVVSESAVESKNLDEVSDKVSSMIQRDSSAAMSANAAFSASGSIGVWQASASANLGLTTSISQSNQRSNEMATRRLKETTRRASERITKTFSLRIRDVEDITTTNLTRRVIKNEDNQPVSYGLRRVFNRIKVKVQDLGPYLVWQLYLRNPGAGLARSRFVHFMDSQPVSNPLDPPAVRPRPTGGTDTGTTSANLNWDNSRRTYYITLVIRTGSDRKVTAVSIDSITDLEGGGKEDLAPSAKNNVQWGQSYDTGTNSFSVNIGVLEGDAASVSVNYTYVYEAGDEIIQAWEDEKKVAEDKFRQADADARAKALVEQFERDKALITEKSNIKPRPANDLRREERYEVMNRMISHLFARGENPKVPSPLEIEYFHRYFDIEAMFLYTHPSWWKPRYSPTKTGLGRPSYEITAESEPAPMGSSLGWIIQLDGDTRRNEFLNSPWVRVCLPIRPGRERESIAWLAEHIEGEIGYNPNTNPLKGLLGDMETIRQNQESLGINGPDYVTVDSTIGAPPGPVKPENIFPIIDEFEVTLPTEGFVYDELRVVIP